MKLPIEKVIQENTDIHSYYIQRPDSYNYYPGQYVYITLPKLLAPSEKGNTRAFTLSSSPHEKFLRFTTEIHDNSGYKITLANLTPGDYVDVSEPNGSFVIDENTKGSHIAIAGGLGITPFRSIFSCLSQFPKKPQISLFYFETSPQKTIFVDELSEICDAQTSLRFIHLDTKIDDKTKIQYITSLVKQHSETPEFWLTGSPSFVHTIEDLLLHVLQKVGDIHLDAFTGYT